KRLHFPERPADDHICIPCGNHFIGSDAVQRGARHGLNSNRVTAIDEACYFDGRRIWEMCKFH
ncbi:hypothetical protein, partial [Eubacterium sp. BIOML-A1]